MIIYSVLEVNFDYNNDYHYYYDTGTYSTVLKAFTELSDAENYVDELNFKFIEKSFDYKYPELGIASGKRNTTFITLNKEKWNDSKDILIEKFNLTEDFICLIAENVDKCNELDDAFNKLNKNIVVELFKFMSEKSIIVFNLYEIAECELVNIFS